MLTVQESSLTFKLQVVETWRYPGLGLTVSGNLLRQDCFLSAWRSGSSDLLSVLCLTVGAASLPVHLLHWNPLGKSDAP